jgi:hypothetical protein
VIGDRWRSLEEGPDERDTWVDAIVVIGLRSAVTGLNPFDPRRDTLSLCRPRG